MTDRYSGFLVVLDKDLREDDAKPLLNAISQLKGVLNVEPVLSDISLQVAQARTKQELFNKLIEVLK